MAGALACAAVAAFAPPARAYIPAVGSLLRKAASRVAEGGRSKQAQVEGTLQLGEAPPVAATLTLRFPLSCKLDGAGIAVSASGEPGRMQLKDDGHAGARDLLKLACPLIAYRGQNTPSAERTLRLAAAEAGIALESAPTALTRLFDRVAIVIGAPARLLDRPQLWLYKDNAAPARLLARSEDRIDDLRLLQYGNPAAADWLPRVVELWHGGSLVARFEALETRGFKPINEDGDDDARE
ncbi:MAG: hypothetical protein NVS4B10_16600 [Myxococcales bacterium]